MISPSNAYLYELRERIAVKVADEVPLTAAEETAYNDWMREVGNASKR